MNMVKVDIDSTCTVHYLYALTKDYDLSAL